MESELARLSKLTAISSDERSRESAAVAAYAALVTNVDKIVDSVNWTTKHGFQRLRGSLNVPCFCEDFEFFGCSQWVTIWSYQYELLDARRKQIRLVKIPPSLNKRRVTCRLQISELDEKLTYDALS